MISTRFERKRWADRLVSYCLPGWIDDFTNNDESMVYKIWYESMAEFFPLMEEVLDESLEER